ncbi:MAG TPA: PAS domain S-box protein [Stellaceae bacterium]|nr:PAS domain S-box protein [Stellaceae bacterium]
MQETLSATRPAVDAGSGRSSLKLVAGGAATAGLTLCTAAILYETRDVLTIAGWTIALLVAWILAIREFRIAVPAARQIAREHSALEHEIELHRRIFETSLDLILVTDRKGQFIEVSPSAGAVLGYEPSHMIGHWGSEFIYPDDLDSTRNEMRLARRGHNTRNFECRYVHKDGHTVTLTWTGVWSEEEAKHFFIGRDMTVQKQLQNAQRVANETLTAIINASPVAIVCLSSERIVTVWSRAAEQIFGYTAEEVLGRPYMLVPPGDDAKTEYDKLFERAMAGETLRDIRVTRSRRDGSLADISFDAAAMHGPNGIKAIAYALSDITERNRLEQQLRHSQKMDAIGQLTGGVAHDFNNMLAVITGTIDILANAVADKPEIAAIARLISEAADRGAELTARLLAFSRKQPLQPSNTDANEAVTQAANLLRPTLGEQIDIEWKLAPNAWPALVDPAQLVTALLNLAVNARDAMPEGGKLTLETANVFLDEDYAMAHSEVVAGPYVLFAVSDTGPGIPPAIREKVFEPFFTTKGVGQGTGLGLSMVYGLVKQSGGHIKLYSEEAQGTTFKIYLPRAGAHADVAEAKKAAHEPSTGKETILVVEDDPIVRKSVTTQLASLGYRAIMACDASEALAIIDRGIEFDLLFTDLVMPGAMNGSQLAKEVAKRRSPLKVLFTSGYTERAVLHHGRLEPGVLLLPKPYRTADLARAIRQALEAGEPAQMGHATAEARRG